MSAASGSGVPDRLEELEALATAARKLGFSHWADTTDELVGEVRRLRAEVEKLDRVLDHEIATRDAYHEWADAIAYAVGGIEEIGEHSSGNNPWANAIELVGGLRAKVETLKRERLEPFVDKGDLIALDEIDLHYCGWGDCRNADVVALRWAGIEHGFLPVCTRHMMERVVAVQVVNDVLGDPDV